MEDHETRIKVLEKARKELEDAFVVMTHLETKQSNVSKTQASGTAELQRQADEQRLLNRETDKRIADLVSVIGEWIRRQDQNGRN